LGNEKDFSTVKQSTEKKNRVHGQDGDKRRTSGAQEKTPEGTQNAFGLNESAVTTAAYELPGRKTPDYRSLKMICEGA
jgi:hypothetical protein